MALYALLYHYTDDQDLVATHRPAHRQYLKGLFERGDLVVAGPLGEPGPPRGLLVLDVESVHQVKRIAEADPFSEHDVIEDYTIGNWSLSFGADRLG